jgi:hypothetical protein
MISITQKHDAPHAPCPQSSGIDSVSGDAGAHAALLRASQSAKRLAAQTQTQWVVSAQSKVAQLFGIKHTTSDLKLE